MARTRVQQVAIVAESTFGTDPGTGHVSVETFEPITLQDDTELFEHHPPDGEPFPHPHKVGKDGATMTFVTPLKGPDVSADADTENVDTLNADDYHDILWTNAFGTGNAQSTDTVSSATSSTMTLGGPGDVWAARTVGPIIDSATLSGRAQWVASNNDASNPYNIVPDFATAPSATGLAVSAKQWHGGGNGDGASISMLVDMDGTQWDLAGGRVTNLVWSGEAGQRARQEVTVKFDNKLEPGTQTLPTPTFLAADPICMTLCSVNFNNVYYHCKSVSIDFGINALEIMSTNSTNARQDIEVLSVWPTITIEPQFATAFETAFRAGTEGAVMIQFGSGIVGSGRYNTMAFFAPACQVTNVSHSDDSGLHRQTVALRPVNPQNANTRLFTIARA